MADSAADRQIDAEAALEATARRIYDHDRAVYHDRLIEAVKPHHRVIPWEEASPERREFMRAVTRRLVIAGIVTPLDLGPPPLDGQLEIER